MNDDEALSCADADEWRSWLDSNGRQERSVWLIVHQDLDLGAAVEQALCFGWVDSKTLRRDERTTYQCFTPRNPRSTWSKSNRERIERLTAAGLMMPPGEELVALARRTGTWDLLKDAQDLIVPADLRAALARDPQADEHFRAFPPSSRRAILEWITLAKRPETRARRIAQTVEQAAGGVRIR
ncbi:YdeI/OmpD-associated family protein [Kribbella sp. NPDC054772]